MIQIGDVVVSLDVFQEKFLCDLGACKGACCIEGDAGAPVELDEVMELEEVLPVIWDELASEARAVIEKQGVVYTDQEGDLVTSIVNNKDCVFTCYDENGCCYCAIEKAYREGKTAFYKPVSCHLYPIRIGDYGPYKAVNYAVVFIFIVMFSLLFMQDSDFVWKTFLLLGFIKRWTVDRFEYESPFGQKKNADRRMFLRHRRFLVVRCEVGL